MSRRQASLKEDVEYKKLQKTANILEKSHQFDDIKDDLLERANIILRDSLGGHIEFKEGDLVEGEWTPGEWYTATITKIHKNGNCLSSFFLFVTVILNSHAMRSDPDQAHVIYCTKRIKRKRLRSRQTKYDPFEVDITNASCTNLLLLHLLNPTATAMAQTQPATSSERGIT
jgi:hypothetical protein